MKKRIMVILLILFFVVPASAALAANYFSLHFVIHFGQISIDDWNDESKPVQSEETTEIMELEESTIVEKTGVVNSKEKETLDSSTSDESFESSGDFDEEN